MAKNEEYVDRSTGVLQASGNEDRSSKIAAILPKFNPNRDMSTSPADYIKVRQDSALAAAEPGSMTGAPLPAQVVLRVPIAHLYDSDANPRESYDEDKISHLAISLAKEGQLQPILVIHHPSLLGMYMITEGHSRKQAAAKLGLETVDCILIEAPSRRARYLVGRTSNTERNSITDLDDGVTWGRLISEGVFDSYAELNRELGLNYGKSQLSRMKSFADLPEECLDIMRKHKDKFSCAFAYEVKTVFEKTDLKTAINFAGDIVKRDLSIAVAMSWAKRLTGQTEPRLREAKTKTSISVGSTQIASIKSADYKNYSILLEEDVPDGFSDKLAEAIKKIFMDSLTAQPVEDPRD